MIHLRLTCPAELSEEVLALLEAEPAVANLVVARGAARKPDGDAIGCDVSRGSANDVIEALTATGVAERGSLVVENVDAAVGQDDRSAGRLRSRFREHEPIWAMSEARVVDDGTYPPSWFLLMAIAGVIGATGILTNSQILIVGAMVVGPEYGAMLSMAWGTTKRDWLRVRDGATALAVGFSIAIVASLFLGLAIRALGDTPTAFTAGIRPVSELINTPNIFSFIVALVAGVVGVVALTTSRASTMIGVFISVTTIPAAADIGLSAAYSSWSEAGGSFLQLLMNVVVLTVVGMLVLVVQRRIWARATATAGQPSSTS